MLASGEADAAVKHCSGGGNKLGAARAHRTAAWMMLQPMPSSPQAKCTLAAAPRSAAQAGMAAARAAGMRCSPRPQPAHAPACAAVAARSRSLHHLQQLRPAACALAPPCVVTWQRCKCRAQQTSSSDDAPLDGGASPAAPLTPPLSPPPPLWLVPWDGGAATRVSLRFAFLWCAFGALAPALVQELAGGALPPTARAVVQLPLGMLQCAAVWHMVRALAPQPPVHAHVR